MFLEMNKIYCILKTRLFCFALTRLPVYIASALNSIRSNRCDAMEIGPLNKVFRPLNKSFSKQINIFRQCKIICRGDFQAKFL